MDAVLSGRDSLVVLPTGGGKSLCFQAPALVSDGLAVVVSPLISLMKDQVDTLVGNGVPAACYNSSLPSEQKSRGRRGVREGRYQPAVRRARAAGRRRRRRVPDPAVVAAGQLHRRRRSALHQPVGPRFPPRVPPAGAAARALAVDQPARLHRHRDRARAARHRRAARPAQRRSSWSARSIGRTWSTACCARSTLKAQLLDVLERHAARPASSTAPSRKEVDALAQWLQDTGWRARPYHAGLADDERHRNQDAFLNEEIDIVVATVAFGMGIDRSDVRFVIHAGAPQSLEHYQQESGRAGRDGLEAECVLISSAADFLKWRDDAREERRADGRAARPAARHGALRRQRRLPPRALVGYFGETFTKDDCGACDYCLGELEPVAEPVTVARKILSCVARVGQRFGAAHVTNVLRGSDSEQVRSRGHHELSVFGLLKDATIDEVRGYIDQLLAHGLLQQTDDEYPVLQIDGDGPGADEGRRRRAGPDAGAAEAAGSHACRSARASRRKPGKASIAICSSSCARCGWRSPARAACRRT